MKRKGLWIRILGLLMLGTLLAGCGGSTNGANAPAASPVGAGTNGTSSTAAPEGAGGTAAPAAASGPIKVGSKNFTEEFILGEMYAQLLEHGGLKVERKLGLESEAVAHQALLNGEIDLYPEYTSTGLMVILKLPKQNDAKQIVETVRREYEKQFQLTWLDPALFNDTNALAMTKKRAQELGIQSYSDLAQKAPELVLGGPAEFAEREDGIKGLQKAYGGFQFKEFKQLGTGALRYQALQDGQIDVVVAFSTDGQIGGYDLQVLNDDKTFYPIYQAAPVIRQATLKANPQIADLLNSLAPKLDSTTMAKLNWMVDGPDKKEPAAVAKQFLTEQGLLK